MNMLKPRFNLKNLETSIFYVRSTIDNRQSSEQGTDMQETTFKELLSSESRMIS